MPILIKNGPQYPKFGDADAMSLLWYLNPTNGLVEPVYCLGNLPIAFPLGACQIEIVIIPSEYRNVPIAQVPLEVMRKIVFKVDKNLSLSLVSTNPPTIYSTTQEELALWVKEKSPKQA